MNFRNLPKIELHRHIELCLRKETIKELAPQFGIELPDEKTYEDRFLILEPMKDLGSALNKFLDTQKLLASPEILERIAFEAAEDCYNEGTRIVEFRYAPTFVQLNHEHMSFDVIHESLVKGLKRAEEMYPIATGLICIIQRILPVEVGRSVTEFAIDHKDTMIGLDLADNEEGFDSKPFSDFFLKARDAGLGITVHAGEANLPKSPRYVTDAIEYLGAQRIGHGIQIHRDPAVMKSVIDKNIVLEVCPKSNWLTNAISDLNDHPVRTLYDAGVPITLNTDDPGVFNTDLNQEYQIVADRFGFEEDDFKKMNEIAYKASFISEEKKSKVWPVN